MKLTVGEAARVLDISPDQVRRLEGNGELKAERTAGGVRLFESADVERLARKRKKTSRRPPVEAA